MLRSSLTRKKYFQYRCEKTTNLTLRSLFVSSGEFRYQMLKNKMAPPLKFVSSKVLFSFFITLFFIAFPTYSQLTGAFQSKSYKCLNIKQPKQDFQTHIVYHGEQRCISLSSLWSLQLLWSLFFVVAVVWNQLNQLHIFYHK